ncbi:MAG: universal stress protein [Trueperaceae bacterium]|nr:universal stress protein [Trueperaceae bacterium]
MVNTILVGTDGSEAAKRAAEFALDDARANDAKLIIVYVIEWSRYDFLTPEELEGRGKVKKQEVEKAQSKILDPLLASLNTDGVSIETIIRHGHPTRTLDKIARDLNVDQIFVGRQGQSRIERALFGSVASNLVQIAPVPVTVVP